MLDGAGKQEHHGSTSDRERPRKGKATERERVKGRERKREWDTVCLGDRFKSLQQKDFEIHAIKHWRRCLYAPSVRSGCRSTRSVLLIPTRHKHTWELRSDQGSVSCTQTKYCMFRSHVHHYNPEQVHNDDALIRKATRQWFHQYWNGGQRENCLLGYEVQVWFTPLSKSKTFHLHVTFFFFC